MNIVVKGLDRIVKNFGMANQIVQKYLTIAVRTATLLLVRDLKTGGYVPVRTGALKTSIRPTIMPLKATISPHVNYAIYVHEGTRYMRGRPFFETAVERREKEVQKIFDSAVDNIANELVK